MAIHFAERELAARRQAAAAELARRGLDGLLMFRQESMYYLTGYDTFGYVFFQCLYMGADGETLTLLTRTPDLRQAEHTSVISDIRVWYDAEGVNPADDLRMILDEHDLKSGRLGIETDAYGLTGFNLRRVEAALDGFCELVEASDLVTRLRAVKSEAEISYVPGDQRGHSTGFCSSTWSRSSSLRRWYRGTPSLPKTSSRARSPSRSRGWAYPSRPIS